MQSAKYRMPSRHSNCQSPNVQRPSQLPSTLPTVNDSDQPGTEISTFMYSEEEDIAELLLALHKIPSKARKQTLGAIMALMANA